ncbi:mitogen-activated protein kinase kinase kinase YODA-like isoform X1 [Zingiber officinale]|uniref:mitogen-activated protein kinase kinase kinase YODA-like isoform X1 n=1 Tax=Zingiber officinale TaxID=94328 RepID=UPI001C4BFD69|nr:mitogen-activated protein kinase kinase kinase YODA-like isoform X1 [Zingiber officinale]XP_042409025.1 mitogen-activated protein kinase kinase kinase YODA-like isoform X1 [Zingiber officinale]XP_042409026.1 mitogen-activated protein kinase kinase kinase YODA-like isoform X2 [Zingiber officinale]XP_042409027.1 mitogen-activated protein kinase kinase kinase YODA-like isoform X1 [Zingiber officinale]XP_042409028.1 mitogen-activated protein kinase kinase kinase YODA-like isoform X1 [Zingiber of
MPTLWGKFSSKDAKKKTVKENFIDTLHRFISPSEHKEGSRRIERHSSHAISEKNCRSSSKSQSTSPSSQVSRCQSFAGRPNSLPLPLPDIKSGITRTPSEVHNPRPILEKRGKPPLCLPLPKPHRIPKGLDDFDGELATASASSNCSIDSDDRCDSQLQSPVGNDLENSNKNIVDNHFSLLQKDQFSPRKKCPREIAKPTNFIFGNQTTSSLMWGVPNSYRSNMQISHNSAIGSAPDSSMSSPSRSPMRVLCPDQVPISAYLPTKTVNDVTFNGSGQCSSPGSGQTSGHNSVGVDMLGQFWQHSRGSPECSPIPSPRMTSPGPSSRIHSGTVSPLHPRAGGTAPESPTGRNDDGKKQRHRLPLPPINVSRNSPFSPSNSAVTTPISRSPGKTENPASPGSRWKKGKLIGCGTFGHVYAGFNSESGEMCAMKEVTLFMDDAKSKESAKHLGQEISLLSRLQHPNIVQYYGSEMIDDKLYIYLEYVSGGSIHKLLQDYGQFGEPAIRSYTQQILSGLAYLHAKNTVHRDIKGANILVDPNGRVKLADFGMAKHITGQSCPLSFKGSPYWMAPEVIKNSNGCNLAVDIWSLGCTVLEMATSKPPWSQYEGIAAMFKIGNSKELPRIPDHLSDDGKDFIRHCLQREPSNRPTASELLQHPFVKNASSIEKSPICSEPLEWLDGISSGANIKITGHVKNLSSLDMEGMSINHIRGGIPTIATSDVPIRYLSCPVSPMGSPHLNSRSPCHARGRMSPSPISSPIATSGASTPLTGGNGAIPFSQSTQHVSDPDGFTSLSKCKTDIYLSGTTYHEQKLNLLAGMQQGSLKVWERKTSKTDILSTQFGRLRHGNLRDLHKKQSDRLPPQSLRDQMKLKPSQNPSSGLPDS